MATRIANSIRLILAMFRLYADIETSFGKSVLDILKKQFPGQDVGRGPSQIGHEMVAIARRQLQGNQDDAIDAVQDFLAYITTGSKYETDDKGRVLRDEDGQPIPRKERKVWDFAKDWDTPNDALRAMYRNIKDTAMSRSMTKSSRRKKEKSVEEAFGRRTDDGGYEGAEERMPTGDDSALGKALDDKAAVKEFMGLIDEHLPDLKASLSEDSRMLFDLIFDDEVGSFSSDIKENMGQASALKEKHPELYEKNAKRWSGFVGDLRRKLLDEIWKYIEDEMSYNDYVRLRDQFFSDVSPDVVRKLEKEKIGEKESYQRGLDERKVARLKAKLEETGSLSPKEQGDLDRLKERLEKQGVDVDAIKPDASAGAKRSSILSIAASVAGLARRDAL